MLANIFNLLVQMNERLGDVITTYAAWTYLIVFVLILLEAFPLLTPILPSGSLIIAAGAFAAEGSLNVWWLLALCSLAAAGGDSGNYLLGRGLGIWVFRRGERAQHEHPNLERARAFYSKYGVATLLAARLLPFVRVLAPTLAGMGVMRYPKFLLLNGLGCVIWTSVFLFAGYFFGRIPGVRDNLLLGMLAAGVVLAVLVIVHRIFTKFRAARARRAGRKAADNPDTL